MHIQKQIKENCSQLIEENLTKNGFIHVYNTMWTTFYGYFLFTLSFSERYLQIVKQNLLKQPLHT